MKTAHTALSASVLVAASASANIVVNGGFEDNTAASTSYNLSNFDFNATMADVTAFGGAEEVDIVTNGGFGIDPIEGDWKVHLHRIAPGGVTDAIAMNLTQSITAGTQYDLSFAAHAILDFDPGFGPIEVGISDSAASFGTLVYASGILSTNQWDLLSTSFTAGVNADYLTFRVGDTESWIALDNVSLTVVPAPGAVALLAGAGLLTARRRR